MTHQQVHIDTATALRLVQHVLAEGARLGLSLGVAVVDAGGATLASARMDGAAPVVHGFATDKAYTAAMMRQATRALHEEMEATPRLLRGLASRERMLVWGGGQPIVLGGQVIGGIGVSGAKEDEDIACGRAALAAEGLGWEV